MSSFKNFKIWTGWLVHKYPVLVLLLGVAIPACGIIGFFLFWGFPFLSAENPPVFPNPLLGIVALVVGAGSLFIHFIANIYSLSSENWRVAIDEVLRFQKQHPEYEFVIEKLIRQTRDTKNGIELNEWRENYEKLLIKKASLENLREIQEEIPQQIKEKEAEIKVLQSKL